MATGKTVTYEGATDASKNQAGSVEIDGVELPEGEPVAGLTADQVERLEDLAYHRFTVEEGNGGDELLKLSRPDLDAKAAEAGVENPDALVNKQAVVDAIREKEAGS